MFSLSLCGWRGCGARGSPVRDPAEYRWWVPRWPLFHPGVSWSPRQPGPGGGVTFWGAGLDPGCTQADTERWEHGWQGEGWPVSLSHTDNRQIIRCFVTLDLVGPYHNTFITIDLNNQNHRGPIKLLEGLCHKPSKFQDGVKMADILVRENIKPV